MWVLFKVYVGFVAFLEVYILIFFLELLASRWLSRIRDADPSALNELSNAVSVKDAKYSVRDNPSCQAVKFRDLLICVMLQDLLYRVCCVGFFEYVCLVKS